MRTLLSAAPLLFAWLWTWRHLSAEWIAHPNYEYGWGVPPLLVVLLWQQWRGAMRPVRSRTILALLAGVGVIVWILGEAIRQHDPIWRLAGALLMAGCTILTAAWLLRAGGWPLLKRAAFPLVFAWTALPWPTPLELACIQRLLHIVTSVAVFFATVVGLPVLQRGNVIELAAGPIGVDEACSGLQSLQAAFMASLFLGGFYRLSLGRMLALTGLGLAAAMLGNLLRVFTLVGVVAHEGLITGENWHDAIGAVATTAVFVGVLGIARLLRPRTSERPTMSEPIDPPTPATACSVLMLLTASVFLLGLNRPSASDRLGPHWMIDTSALAPEWKAERFSPSREVQALLRYAGSDTWRFRSPDGGAVWLYHFFWEGNGMPPFAFSHTPAMCMPWAGWSPVGVPWRADVEGLPAMVFTFAQGSTRVTAVQIVRSGGEVRLFTDFDPTADNRFRRFISAWRAPGEHIDEELLLYFPARTEASALALAKDLLGALLAR